MRRLWPWSDDDEDDERAGEAAAEAAAVDIPIIPDPSAAAFFDVSAQQWPACRQYTHTQSESQWSIGQISNANGTLSTTATQHNASAPGWGCGRALALTADASSEDDVAKAIDTAVKARTITAALSHIWE